MLNLIEEVAVRCARSLPILVVWLGACASPRTPAISDSPELPPRVMGGVGGTDVRISADREAVEGSVDAAADQVWRVLPLAWSDSRVKEGEPDATTRSLRSGLFRVPRRIAGKPLADFFDCGFTISGPRVNLWDVYIDVVTSAVAESAVRTRVATIISVSAKPRDGSSTSAVLCTSKGELERIILGNVRSRLGLGP